MSGLLQEVFLQAFGGLENNTSGGHCPPMEAPPGPILVPALAGISGGDLSLTVTAGLTPGLCTLQQPAGE